MKGFRKSAGRCGAIDGHISRAVRHTRGTQMNAIDKTFNTDRYARSIQASKRVRWDIDEDVIRGRRFDVANKFLPDGLSQAEAFATLSPDEKRFVSQIQGRTYANVFGLV